jgi:hypothetical protein
MILLTEAAGLEPLGVVLKANISDIVLLAAVAVITAAFYIYKRQHN